MSAVTDQYRILITDDDDSHREALRDIVEHQGYRPVLASSGEEAVDIVRDAPIHLALMDMHMPSMTGLEALRLMHQIHAMLPAILVTADASGSLLREACREHVYSVIHKPVSKGVVLSTVIRALDRFYGRDPKEPSSEDEGPNQ